MIDRLAELLGIAEREDEDESERDESVVEAGPFFGPGRRRTDPAREEAGPEDPAAEASEARESPAVPAGAGAETVPEELERAIREAETLREERSGVRPPEEDSVPAAPFPAPPGEDGLVSPEESGPGGADWLPSLGREGDQSGLELLYRAAARAGETAAEPLSAGQTARQVLPDPVPSEPVRMTVEEMDRAMRRDSRRYDGGMTIY